MQGKTVIVGVLLMSLVMFQIQVEAKSCCPSRTARNIYNTCRFAGGSRERCASLSGCKANQNKCVPPYNNDILENSGDVVSEYCKLGCTSSACGALTTLQNSDASEIMNEAVAKCIEACSNLCTKGSIAGVETA